GSGAMASIGLSAAAVAERLPDGVEVAAVNGPASVVVSGEPGAVRELVEACEADGVRARAVPVDYASHCAHVEPLRDDLLGSLGRDEGTAAEFLRAAAHAHVNGLAVDWTAAFGTGRVRVDLPTYPFQRRRYWPAARPAGAGTRGLGVEQAGHPLLGAGVELA